MATIKKSFPHPVLNVHDDVSGEFKVTFHWSCDRYNYCLETIFNLINPTLQDMIQHRTAAFVMNVECADTFYRNSFLLYEFHNTISLKSDLLRNRVDVTFYICSEKQILDYNNTGAHSDYDGLSFKIDKGDILAYGGSTYFLAEKNYELLKAVSSIMQIKRGNHKKGLANINFNGDKITIELSQENYIIYNIYKNEKKYEAVFHCSIVLPHLYKALAYIQTNDEDYKKHKWYQVLEKRLDDESLTIKIEDEGKHFEIIQQLFGTPYDRLFESLKTIEDENA